VLSCGSRLCCKPLTGGLFLIFEYFPLTLYCFPWRLYWDSLSQEAIFFYKTAPKELLAIAGILLTLKAHILMLIAQPGSK